MFVWEMQKTTTLFAAEKWSYRHVSLTATSAANKVNVDDKAESYKNKDYDENKYSINNNNGGNYNYLKYNEDAGDGDDNENYHNKRTKLN